MCARETCVARCSAARRPRPPPDEQRSSPSHVSIFTAPHRTARPPHRRAPLHRARIQHPSRAYITQTARIHHPKPRARAHTRPDPNPRAAAAGEPPTHPGSATAMPRTLACTRRAPDSTDRGPVPRYPGLLRSPVTCAFRRGAACKNLKDKTDGDDHNFTTTCTPVPTNLRSVTSVGWRSQKVYHFCNGFKTLNDDCSIT